MVDGKISVEFAVEQNPFQKFIDLGEVVGKPVEYENGVLVEWSKGVFTDINNSIDLWKMENSRALIKVLREKMKMKRRFLCMDSTRVVKGDPETISTWFDVTSRIPLKSFVVGHHPQIVNIIFNKVLDFWSMLPKKKESPNFFTTNSFESAAKELKKAFELKGVKNIQKLKEDDIDLLWDYIEEIPHKVLAEKYGIEEESVGTKIDRLRKKVGKMPRVTLESLIWYASLDEPSIIIKDVKSPEYYKSLGLD